MLCRGHVLPTPLTAPHSTLTFHPTSCSKLCAVRSFPPCRYLIYLDSLAGTEEVIRTFNFDAALVRAATQVPRLSQPVLNAVGPVLLEVI